MNVINQPVLCLNGVWQALGTKTVKEALIAMLGGEKGNSPAAMAIDMVFPIDADGNVDWNSPECTQPVGWDEWRKLPVRDYDLAIHTSNMEIRAPRVIIQPNYISHPLSLTFASDNFCVTIPLLQIINVSLNLIAILLYVSC